MKSSVFALNKNPLLTATLLTAILASTSGTAFSEDETMGASAPATESAVTPSEEKPAAMDAEAAPSYPTRKFQGWVDTSMVYDQQSNVGGYQMAQVGLRMSHEINQNYGGFVQVNGFANSDATDTQALKVRAREAYGYYQTNGGGFKIAAGKYYAPIGFELADPPDLYQFSNSLVFANLIPTELVGIIATTQLTDSLDLKLYTAGPWDNDNAALSMGSKNFGTRLGVGLGDLGGIGLSAIGGPQPADEGLNRIAIDLDGALKPADGLLVGFEVNVNMIQQRFAAASTTATGLVKDKGYVMPLGFLIMANYAFTDLFNLTVRYDMVKDADVSTKPTTEAPGAPLFGPVGAKGTDALTLSSITVGPNFHLTDGWDIFTEVRYDMASEDVFFIDGKPESGTASAAAELIYQF